LSLKADVSTLTLQQRAQAAGLMLDLNTEHAPLITATLHPSVNNAITFDQNISHCKILWGRLKIQD